MNEKKVDCEIGKMVGNDTSGSRKLQKGLYKSVEDCSPPEEQKEKVSDETVDQKNQGFWSCLYRCISNFCCGGEQNLKDQKKSTHHRNNLIKRKSTSDPPLPQRANPHFSRNVQFSHNRKPRISFSHISSNILADNIKMQTSDPSNQSPYLSSIQTYKHEGELIYSDKGNINEYYARNIAKTNEVYQKHSPQICNGKPYEKKERFVNQHRRHYDPQEYRGLMNLGSTCYANSALQCLHKSKYFSLKFKEELNNKKIERQCNQNITGYYQTFLEELQKINSPSPFVPSQLKRQIASKNPIFEYGQNDSIQFFSTFLMALGQELKRPSIRNRKPIDHSLPDDQLLEKTKQRDRGILWSIVDETFTGYYKTTYTCKECKENYILFQKFNVHYLPVPKLNWLERKIPTLEECLDTFQKEEQMRGEHAMGCDRCDKNQTTIKKMEVYEANQIIVICFKRFQGHFKNNQEIDIPFQLLPSQLVANEKDSQYKKKTYKLYAAIIHSGYFLNGGHYYAYCRLDDDYWLKCDDSRVHKVKKSDVSLRDAYALFYSLEDADPSKENQIFQRETNTKKYN